MHYRYCTYGMHKFLFLSLNPKCLIFVVDYSKGFGGKYGVQKDRVDKVNVIFSLSLYFSFHFFFFSFLMLFFLEFQSAEGWEYHPDLEKHESQTGHFSLSILCIFKILFIHALVIHSLLLLKLT